MGEQLAGLQTPSFSPEILSQCLFRSYSLYPETVTAAPTIVCLHESKLKTILQHL